MSHFSTRFKWRTHLTAGFETRMVIRWNIVLRFQFLDVFAILDHVSEMFFVFECAEMIGTCDVFAFRVRVQKLFLFHVFLVFVLVPHLHWR